MKQEDVTALAALLNTTAENVSQAIEEGKVSELITGFATTNQVMPKDDFAILRDNLKKQALSEIDKTKLPKDVYDYVKGSVLEKTEKELARQYGVAEYTNLNGLVEEIIKTKTKTTPDEETSKLKQRIVEIENEKKTEVESVRKTFENKFIDTELNRVIAELPIDAEGEKLVNQQRIVRAMIKETFNFQLEGDGIMAIKDGKPVQDTKLDPVPIREVISQFAKDYVNLRPEQGGRGDSSSLEGTRVVDFAEYCEKNNIRPNSVEMVKAKRELEAKGYKFK